MGLASKKHCKNCIYGYKITDYLYCCDYFLKTDKRRPCPAGAGCTVKTKRKKGKKNAKD